MAGEDRRETGRWWESNTAAQWVLSGLRPAEHHWMTDFELSKDLLSISPASRKGPSLVSV